VAVSAGCSPSAWAGSAPVSAWGFVSAGVDSAPGLLLGVAVSAGGLDPCGAMASAVPPPAGGAGFLLVSAQVALHHFGKDAWRAGG
jgi:hypothetical protein